VALKREHTRQPRVPYLDADGRNPVAVSGGSVAGAASVSLLAIWKASPRAAIVHSRARLRGGRRFALSQFPLGDSVDVLVCREEAERFIEEVRGDDPELAKPLRIEERELEAGGHKLIPAVHARGLLGSHRYGDSNASHVSPSGTPAPFPPKMTTRVLEASHAIGAEWRCGPMS
jgi:hypothetical protein